MAIRVDATEPKLEHLLDAHIEIDAPQMIAGPLGTRQIFMVKGGRFDGRVSGEVLPGGADWAYVRSDAGFQLDVRITLKSDDGALIFAQYGGLLLIPPTVMPRIFSGEDVPLNEYYFYTTPTFQTGDERYAWLNQRVTVARGRAAAGAVEYRVWTVENVG